MPNLSEHTMPLEVRSYDTDAWGELPDSMLLHMLEHLAWAASAVGGFDIAWYESHGVAWVVRRMTLARPEPIRFGDKLVGRTWISNARRVRSARDYELSLAPDGPVVAVAARADWVFVDRATQRPIAIDPSLLESIELGEPVAGLQPLILVAPAASARLFSATRRAGRTEADSMGHINNAVYTNWLEEALADALAEVGLPLAVPGRLGPRLVTTHMVLDYLQSARPGDEIEVRTRFTGATSDPTILAWEQEILLVSSPDPLLRCASQRRLIDLDAATFASRMVK